MRMAEKGLNLDFSDELLQCGIVHRTSVNSLDRVDHVISMTLSKVYFPVFTLIKEL